MDNTNKHYLFYDPDYKYTDPKTGLLRNLPNITDAKKLEFFEHSESSAQIKILEENPIPITNSEDIFKTHHAIFKNIYPFAGKPRTVPTWKKGIQFAQPEEFRQRLKQIDKLINGYKKISLNQSQINIKLQISNKLAEIINAINWMHCFREGNGRTQRAVACSLALEKGYRLEINIDKNSETYKKYMTGTVENDNEILSNVIFESLKPELSLRKNNQKNNIQKFIEMLKIDKLILKRNKPTTEEKHFTTTEEIVDKTPQTNFPLIPGKVFTGTDTGKNKLKKELEPKPEPLILELPKLPSIPTTLIPPKPPNLPK